MMSSEDNVQTFIERLDDLLQKYNDLLNMSFDRECLRSIKLQQMKYKEKISALEAKLRIAKMKLKFETDLRMKSEEEHEKIVETLKSKLAEKSRKKDIFSDCISDDDFFTATNSFIMAENDLNESNLLTSNFRKHRAHLQCSSSSGINSNVNSYGVFTMPSKSSYRTTTKIKSPDISYPGIEELKECEKSPEPCADEIFNSLSKITPVKYESEKFFKSRYETFAVSPTKNSSPSYFSPRKGSTPLSRKSPFLNASLDRTLYESDNERCISKLAPLIPPMIPMAVIHGIDEIEKRGLKEIGLYRMVGDEEDIMTLHEKFDNSETDIDLSDINVHSIATFLKSFFYNFPLIPKMFHETFAQIIVEKNKDDLYYAISELPQANRDTLAYLIIHLRRVSFSTSCKMSASKLSVVFGPIVFGLHIDDKENQLSDIPTSVIEELLKLPSSYWNSFIVDPTSSETPTKLRNSPTTEQIVRKKANKFFSTNVRKKKYFT
ncbi:uncharacterized protein LOC135836190 [Planococcus citri]|uniref:uncharacterized protein LOC135836190 n=1 Tax=Planococcus citri TaxID=170843 RepID=UPI0031F7C4EA